MSLLLVICIKMLWDGSECQQKNKVRTPCNQGKETLLQNGFTNFYGIWENCNYNVKIVHPRLRFFFVETFQKPCAVFKKAIMAGALDGNFQMTDSLFMEVTDR